MTNHLRKLLPYEIFDMVHFVVSENYKHHTKENTQENLSTEIKNTYNEELTYSQNSKTYLAKDSEGSILGTIRVLQWNYIDPLPIQKIFGVNPFSYVDPESVNDIFHIGRLAIQKQSPSLNLFKRLISTAVARVCEHPSNVAFAECDCRLLRILSFYGITMQIIGEPRHYLGSETFPVFMNYHDLIGFHVSHEASCSNVDLEMGNSGFDSVMAF